MDNIISTPKVTTGPLPSSQKIYITPEEAPDLSVPLREITQSVATEPKIRVYDTTGPYSDPTVAIEDDKQRRAGNGHLAVGFASSSRMMIKPCEARANPV